MDDVMGVLILSVLSVTGTIIVAVVPRWSEVRERRRASYADAVQGLVAWAEYPYRIARRVDDEPETLKELAIHGRILQERLAFYGAWVSAESIRMGQLYCTVLALLKAVVGQGIQEAWKRPPVSSPSSMNIGSLGIDQVQVKSLTESISKASRTRFGWRRLLGFLYDKRKMYATHKSCLDSSNAKKWNGKEVENLLNELERTEE